MDMIIRLGIMALKQTNRQTNNTKQKNKEVFLPFFLPLPFITLNLTVYFCFIFNIKLCIIFLLGYNF